MTPPVHTFEIEGDEVRTLLRIQREPVEDLIDTLLVRCCVVKNAIVGGPDAHDVGVRAWPEEGCGCFVLQLGSDPDRLTTIPLAVLGGGAAGTDHKRLAEYRIDHPVGDDPVVLRIQTRGDRVVAGERFRWEDRDQPFGAHAARDQSVEGGCFRKIQIIMSQAIDGDQEDDRITGSWRRFLILCTSCQ